MKPFEQQPRNAQLLLQIMYAYHIRQFFAAHLSAFDFFKLLKATEAEAVLGMKEKAYLFDPLRDIFFDHELRKIRKMADRGTKVVIWGNDLRLIIDRLTNIDPFIEEPLCNANYNLFITAVSPERIHSPETYPFDDLPGRWTTEALPCQDSIGIKDDMPDANIRVEAVDILSSDEMTHGRWLQGLPYLRDSAYRESKFFYSGVFETDTTRGMKMFGHQVGTTEDDGMEIVDLARHRTCVYLHAGFKTVFPLADSIAYMSLHDQVPTIKSAKLRIEDRDDDRYNPHELLLVPCAKPYYAHHSSQFGFRGRRDRMKAFVYAIPTGPCCARPACQPSTKLADYPRYSRHDGQELIECCRCTGHAQAEATKAVSD